MRAARVTQVGLAVLGALLALGAVLGSGLAQTVLDTPDPLVWLRDDRGQVARLNPETGRLVDRLQVGAAGDELHVEQGDGVLVVTNLRTGEVTVIDVPLLRVSGVRLGPTGVKVLLADRRIFLVDKEKGQVELVDPLTAATVGAPFVAGTPFADAAVDATGTVWALESQGTLVALVWVGTAFEVRERVRVPDAGLDTVLVAHERGVTAYDPNGSTTRVGTGRDRTLRSTGLAGPLLAPAVSPTDLVPVTSGATAEVRVAGPEAVVTVDAAAFGCPRLGRPAVYRGLVYLPCPRARTVLVLDGTGRRAGADLTTPAGDELELVLHAGLLIVNVPGAATGLVVKPDGSTVEIRADDPRVPVVNPSTRPTALPSGLAIRTPKAPPPRRDQTTTGRGGPTGTPSASTVGPPPPPTPTAPPTGPPPGDLTPRGVTATARPDGTIHVAWTPPPLPPTGYQVLRQDTGQPVATAAAGATLAIVTGQPLGQPVSFVVVALTPARGYPSAPSNPVSAYGRPGGPGVSVELAALSPTRLTLRVTVDVRSDGGRPVTGYDLTVASGGGRTLLRVTGVPIGRRPYEFTADCAGPSDLCLRGGTVTATATLANPAGAGPPTTTNAGIPGPPAFAYGQSFMYVSTGGRCLDVDLRIHACDGSAGQLWRHLANGPIHNVANGLCLAANDDLHFASDGCSERPKRWSRLSVDGNEAQLRNQDSGQECVYVTGDPAGEGVRVLDREQCGNGAQERWTAWRQAAGVPLTALAPSAEESTVDSYGWELVPLLVVALVVALARGRRRPC